MKKWLLDPTCDAELFLRKLFKNNQIDATDTPLNVQNKYAIFRDFSAAQLYSVIILKGYVLLNV